jgi:hypothetical protein
MNEAIEIEILSGTHSGFHDSVDAGLAGSWLAIPLGSVLFGFGISGLYSMKQDAAISAKFDDDDAQVS